jgi:hypothetical protein
MLPVPRNELFKFAPFLTCKLIFTFYGVELMAK